MNWVLVQIMVSKELKVVLAVLALFVAVLGVVVAIQSNQASIDYWLEKPDTLAEGLNHITAYCKNGGGMDGDFYLVMTFHNATFSDQTELPYEQVDNFTVKVKFVLHKGDSNQKVIYFRVWENITTEFSITLTLEKADIFQFLKANGIFPIQLSYQWNEQTKLFNCTNAT